MAATWIQWRAGLPPSKDQPRQTKCLSAGIRYACLAQDLVSCNRSPSCWLYYTPIESTQRAQTSARPPSWIRSKVIFRANYFWYRLPQYLSDCRAIAIWLFPVHGGFWPQTLTISKVNRCWTSVPNFIKIRLVLFEKSQRTNQPTNQQTHVITIPPKCNKRLVN